MMIARSVSSSVRGLLTLCLVSGVVSAGAAAQAHDASLFRDNETTRLFRKLGKNAIWNQVAKTPMAG